MLFEEAVGASDDVSLADGEAAGVVEFELVVAASSVEESAVVLSALILCLILLIS